MILVNCPWMQKDIIKVIEAIEYNDVHVFKHVKTDGIRIYFDSKIGDNEKNVRKSLLVENALIMEAIKEVPNYNVLAISIVPVINGSSVEGYKYTIGGYTDPTDS